MTKDLPVTIGKEYQKEYQVGKKGTAPVLLTELINVEDSTVLMSKIEELSMNGAGSLRIVCRFVPENNHYYICCEMRREKRLGKTADHLFGVIMDVGEFRSAARHEPDSDPLLQELGKKVANNISPKDMTGIVEIIGKEQISAMQIPLKNTQGVYSAVFSEKGEFICTHNLEETQFDVSRFKYKREIQIKINYNVHAVWVVASNDEQLLAGCAKIHEILAESLSKSINCSILLYNEMVNTERANKLLSETITQQILLNNIYTKVFNEHNRRETMHAIVNMTGEFLKLDRITVCEDIPEIESYRTDYEWIAAPRHSVKQLASKKEFKYSDYPDLTEELRYYETYYSSDSQHNVLGVNFSSYVASNLNGDGSKYGMIIYLLDNPERVLSQAEKRLLRSVSQIIAAVIMRCKDNEKLEKLNESLAAQAFYDQKLKIKNRVSLENDINRELEFGRPGSVVLFTIPTLRDFTTFEGEGDALAFLRSLLGSVSQYEKISVEPYRFADETFAVLLRGAAPKDVEKFCEDLSQRFNKPWQINSAEYYFDFVAGVSSYPESGKDVQTILRAGIMALEKAAQFGGNSFAFFSETFGNLEAEDYNCTKALRNAVKNNMDGLVVKYTPVYSSRDDRIIAGEALIAFEKPDLTAFPPRVIMRVAEKMGIDAVIGYWLIKRACELCKEVREKNSEIRICISATARSLSSGTLVSSTKKALDETGLTPEGLVLCFSERIITTNSDRFMATLSELKKIGVTVIIDNVGSYYSLASLLRHSVISGAAVDVTLLTGQIDNYDEEYIRNIISLSKTNDVKFGVRSIQNEEQLALVTDASADWYQSEYRSGAMSGEEFFKIF
jgi:EAL domain-containing protein (putative c-di-GMP-specific phosphodiesterase class I)/GGDEF domain-containing protein